MGLDVESQQVVPIQASAGLTCPRKTRPVEAGVLS